MTLYRLKLRPSSPWRTPWQADTLTGMLLATCARVHGPDVLRDRLIDPMLANSPPFVLSDACPGDLLPMPIWLRLADWPDHTDHKALKRARWLTPHAFQLARAGQTPRLEDLLPDNRVFRHHARHHNTLSRLTDTTGDAEQGLAPFNRPETRLLESPSQTLDYLSVYCRILDPDAQAAADLLMDLLHELSLTGFGADISTGRGQFEIPGDPQPVPELDAPPAGANAVVTLSTFQPGASDPTRGLWDAFPKFGKLGPDFGLPDEQTHKNTLILFRPGACFRTDDSFQKRGFLGRALPMGELLSAELANQLQQRNVDIIHPAFALTVPAAIPASIPTE